MTVNFNIDTLGIDELRQLVLVMQHRVMIQSAQQEMDRIEIESLRAENAAMKKVLADRIVALLVHPSANQSPIEDFIRNVEGEENGEETEAKPVIVDDKDKDKYQA